MNITCAELDKLQQTHAGRITIGPSAAESLAKIERAAKQTEGYFDLITKAVNVNAMQQLSTEDRYKSKWERLYALELEAEREIGHIVRWAYEPIGLRIDDGAGKSCVYWPDFVAWRHGMVECIEIKGKGKFALRPMARVKFLAAKRLFPEFAFKMLIRADSGWTTIL